jgi:hypothetical protein
MLLLFGLLDGGRMTYFSSVLSGAAREAARVAAVEASWVGWSAPNCNTAGGPACPPSVTGAGSLYAHVVSGANRMVAGLGEVTDVHLRCDKRGDEPNATWTGVSCDQNDVGDVVSVRITFMFRPITPIVGNLMPSVVQTASASMVIH